MDFFQGSIPPNFISFCLEHQNLDDSQTQTNPTPANSAGVASPPYPVPVPGMVRNLVPSPPPFPPLFSSSRVTRILTPPTDSPVESQEPNAQLSDRYNFTRIVARWGNY